MNRKVIALFLSLIMVFSLSSTVLAVEEDTAAAPPAQAEPAPEEKPEEDKQEQLVPAAALEIDSKIGRAHV